MTDDIIRRAEAVADLLRLEGEDEDADVISELIAALKAQQPALPSSRCNYCDDTGDVTAADGEWRGYCTCKAGQELQKQPAPVGDDGLPPLPEPYIRIPNNGRGPMQVMEPFYSADQLRQAQREAMTAQRERCITVLEQCAQAAAENNDLRVYELMHGLVAAIRQGAKA